MGEYDKKPVQAKAAPTAGPSEDDRFGAGKVGSNLSARIIKVDIVGPKTRITIAQGTEQGTRVGMEGYIKSAEGALATFQILEAQERLCIADVEGVTPDQLRNMPTVVINPTSKNAPRNPQIKVGEPYTVIGVNVVAGQTRITISRGSLHGVSEGMQGTLKGKLVSGDKTFTIVEVRERVSYASVASAPELQESSTFAMFSTNASSSRPVQRRASGASTKTSDVQSTAEAGVAGASSRLPFFDTIQRSFGKHDISGVQAQVGGAATQASQALGAQAYATGNRVAFANAPDLHTAAHEAAHTVQQLRGAVGFQGLGAADDEHERHADAVADAVVAGQPAEPLLDQLAGGGSAGAVQRKVPPKVGARLDDEKIEARVLVDGLHAAQREIDEDRGARSEQAIRALSHLSQCVVVAKRHEGSSGGSSVEKAADSFDQAVKRFSARAQLAVKEVAQLDAANTELRSELALGSSVPSSYVRQATKVDAINTLPSILQLIAARSEAAAQALEGTDHGDRLSAVAKISGELDHHVAYAAQLLAQVPVERRAPLASDFDLAADRMGYVLRWIRTRAGFKEMEQRFLRTVHRFDVSLLTVGTPSVEGRTHVALTETSIASGERERAAFTPSLTHFESTLERWKERQQAAVTRFASLAALEDHEEPSFVVELLKAVFVAALGHFGGYILGAATSTAGMAIQSVKSVKVPQMALDPKKIEQIAQRVTDVSTDAIQSIAGQALQTTRTDPQARARAFFVAGMQIDITDRITTYKDNVAAMVGSGEISPDQINVLSALFNLLLEDAHNAFFIETANAWAKYVARSRLGGSKSDKTVTDMRDYFGEQRPGGTRVPLTSKAHGAGVFRIRMIVHPAGTKPRIDHSATTVMGMNSEIKQAVLEGAGFQFENILLPKEVIVNTDYGRAVIALNERNEVKDVLDWSDVVRKVGVESGYKFWKLWGKGLVLK